MPPRLTGMSGLTSLSHCAIIRSARHCVAADNLLAEKARKTEDAVLDNALPRNESNAQHVGSP
jgi:hypothetical protein